MFIGTHMFAPVFAATSVNLVCTACGRQQAFSGRDLFYIGLCGGLPDFLSPHIRLAARMSSWSHTLWFVLGAIPVIALWCYLSHREGAFRFGIMCWLAIALHLFCDAISGGIALYYPVDGSRWGQYYMLPDTWLALDFIVVSATVLLMVLVKIVEGNVGKKEMETPLLATYRAERLSPKERARYSDSE